MSCLHWSNVRVSNNEYLSSNHKHMSSTRSQVASMDVAYGDVRTQIGQRLSETSIVGTRSERNQSHPPS